MWNGFGSQTLYKSGRRHSKVSRGLWISYAFKAMPCFEWFLHSAEWVWQRFAMGQVTDMHACQRVAAAAACG